MKAGNGEGLQTVSAAKWESCLSRNIKKCGRGGEGAISENWLNSGGVHRLQFSISCEEIECFEFKLKNLNRII